MTDWPRGGYPAGDTPASELKPPPDSMISKSSLHATYTAAEVKVLTAKAREEIAEEIAQALEEFARNDMRGRSDMDIDRAAAIAREIGSKEASA